MKCTKNRSPEVDGFSLSLKPRTRIVVSVAIEARIPLQKAMSSQDVKLSAKYQRTTGGYFLTHEIYQALDNGA